MNVDETEPGAGGERTHRLVEFAMDRPKLVLWLCVAMAVVAALLATGVDIDTDPENMLPSDDEVRTRNEELRETFGTGPLIVVGIVDPDGSVTTPEVFETVSRLHSDIAAIDGVVGAEVLSIETVSGEFDPSDQAGVDAIVVAADADPLLAGNVVSADRTTVALFVPLEEKSDANPVSDDIDALLDAAPALGETDQYVAGLPLAEEAFGREMFIQMAVFAPMAGLLIFLLMLWFFRRLNLVLTAMAVAMLSVIVTMGLLIGSGNPLHIMSSMLPIFLMPIAILDSVHVLSEFFDRYPHHLDRRKTLRVVYGELYRPLAFTSITTGVAFASLLITPIPPIQVFGVFVAVGVFSAWLLTIVLIPALIMTMSENRLATGIKAEPEDHSGLLSRFVRSIGHIAVNRRWPVLAGFAVLTAVALPAITQIEVNDNPVNWFKPGSEVRVATEELNDRLPGTFNANLVLHADDPDVLTEPETLAAVQGIQEMWAETGVVGSSASYADLLSASSADEAAMQLDEAGANPLVASLVTADRTAANIRLQMNNGDNTAMRDLVDRTDDHLEAAPLPGGIEAEWAGETYLNLRWQEKMVSGMLQAFASTLAVVLVLMVVLFRSIRWALLSMLPVLWTVLVVYGALGLIGKSYDMPIAVLSTLVLGIGVDFAIHFVERFRELNNEFGDRRVALRAFFEEPGRALTRNALVIAVGFTPLFLASLTPYLVVGAFISSIIVLSWLATLLMLPAMTAGPATEA
jgi:hydrophobe/amphiphile efflux-3 (HAE3) family protein